MPFDDRVKPEQFLRFVELDEFADDWLELGLDYEQELWGLQNQLMQTPEIGKVVPGTGGLRKMRFGLAARRIGKSGGVRVCYAYFPRHRVIVLMAAYGKHEKDDLSPREKKYIQNFIQRTEDWLDRINS